MSEIERIVSKLQNKSEKSRKRLLWLSTISVSGAVFLVWFTTLGVELGGAPGVELSKKVSPFESVAHILGSVKNDVMLGLGVVGFDAEDMSGEVETSEDVDDFEF